MQVEAHNAELIGLRSENAQLRRQAFESLEKLRKTEERLAQLQHELEQIKRIIFGAKSERFVPAATPDQLPLFDEAPPVAEEPAPRETVTYEKPRRLPARQELAPGLPRRVIIIEPDVDTSGLKKIGEEITETYDCRPAQYWVLQRVRPKYVDPNDPDAGVIIAPLPPRPIEKGIAEPSMLAKVVIDKFQDHLPIYRQLQRFKRDGIVLAPSTVEGWVSASANLLEPLHEALKQELLESGYVQADETPIQVQDPAKKGKTHRGYYWVYHSPPEGLVFMDYQRGRGRDGPAQLLASFTGALQSDGYAVYEKFDDLPGITAYACWAHARRYFFEALGSASKPAEHVLGEIKALYEIERVLRETDPTPENRRRVRQKEALPILERLKTWLSNHRGLPKSPYGQAVTYCLFRWEKLTRYVDDGRIEIDNNLVENAIRPIAIGRKNYLFAGSHDAAQRAAFIYSLLATCKKHDVHPHDWLTDVLTRIPTHPHKRVHELLPHRWKRSNV